MIIASSSLYKYSHSLRFPLDILAEKGGDIALEVEREGFEQLADLGVIIGVGSWKRLKHVRLCRPLEKIQNLRMKLRKLPPVSAFSYLEHLGDGVSIPMLKRMRDNSGHGQRWDNSLTFKELRQGEMISNETRLRREAGRDERDKQDWATYQVQSL